MMRPAQLGTTFSQLQCKYLGIDYREAYRQIATLGFDIVRLCAYWNEIEPQEGEYHFEALDWLLEATRKDSLAVVLAIGAKAPRWPEFHFPAWIEERHNTTQTSAPLDSDAGLAERTLTFIARVVEHARTAPNIRYWQVENEALNRLEVARRRYLSRAFVAREVAAVRSLAIDEQAVMLTNSVSMLPIDAGHDRVAFESSLAMADVVGLNVYTKVPLGPRVYLQPLPLYWCKLSSWRQKAAEQGKALWIAEAQAEPWEWNRLTATERLEYPSTSPTAAVALVTELAQRGFESVLLWGCEYWYWHRKQGSDTWWQAVTRLVKG